MTVLRNDEIAAAGRALYGERWLTSLAKDLNVGDRTLRRWVSGDVSIPSGIKNEIENLLINKYAQIYGLLYAMDLRRPPELLAQGQGGGKK